MGHLRDRREALQTCMHLFTHERKDFHVNALPAQALDCLLSVGRAYTWEAAIQLLQAEWRSGPTRTEKTCLQAVAQNNQLNKTDRTCYGPSRIGRGQLLGSECLWWRQTRHAHRPGRGHAIQFIEVAIDASPRASMRHCQSSPLFIINTLFLPFSPPPSCSHALSDPGIDYKKVINALARDDFHKPLSAQAGQNGAARPLFRLPFLVRLAWNIAPQGSGARTRALMQDKH